MKHIQVRVQNDLADWFDANFSIATKQDFLEQCLIMLRVAVESGALPVPNVYPAKAAMMAATNLIETKERYER